MSIVQEIQEELVSHNSMEINDSDFYLTTEKKNKSHSSKKKKIAFKEQDSISEWNLYENLIEQQFDQENEKNMLKSQRKSHSISTSVINLKPENLVMQISKIYDSPKIKVITKGKCFKGTNQLSQFIYSEQVFKEGVHKMKIQIQHLEHSKFGVLQPGIIIDEWDIQNRFFIDFNGFHRCLFQDGYHNLMKIQGPGFEKKTMRDLIKVGDIIECILDLNQGSFEILCPNYIVNKRKYVADTKKLPIKGYQWRFALCFYGCQHQIQILDQ